MDENQKKLLEEVLEKEQEQPSVAKRFFFGKLIKAAYPHDGEGLLIAELEEFLERELDADAIDRNAEIPESVIRGLGRIGMLGMTIPKEHGGKGLSQEAYCRAMERVARRCGATALFINAHQSIGLKALLLFGSEKQKKRLAKLASGEELAAFALTEPNAGSDAGGIETTAVYDPEKKVYRINGTKQWITNGAVASVLTVMARTEDGKITAFLVTPDMPGFKVRHAALEKVGMRGSKTAVLDFCDVEVPEENILGPKGKGLRVCLTVLDYGRVTFGATCTGMAKACVERAQEHARTRYQFGKPLASFELVKKMLAEMAALTYAMESATYFTAGLLDAGKHDIMVESAILKVFNSEASWKVLYDTMQIFGGRSFFTDEPFERMMRDARLNMIGEGSNEVLKVFIAAVGLRDLGLCLKEAPVKTFLKSLLRRFRLPDVPFKGVHGRTFAKDLRRFGLLAVSLLLQHREQIVEKQLELERVTECAISLYTRLAVLSRMEARGASGTGTLYLALSEKKFEEAFEATGRTSLDQKILALSQEIVSN